MASKLKQRAALINQLCRICGRENKHCIPVFSDSGRQQNIHKKIQSCLPVIVEETDTLPKQICLTCLPKLDATWELHQLCKEGQAIIEQKLNAVSRRYEEEENVMCGVCGVEVQNDHRGVGCEGECRQWFHCWCIRMPEEDYKKLIHHPKTTIWKCKICAEHIKSSYKMNLIDEKVRSLSENRPIIVGESAIISLAPPSPPPLPKEAPASPDTMMVLPEQVMIVEQQQPVAYQSMPVKDNVYPEGLIQVNPIRVAPKKKFPAPKQLPPPPQPSPRRQALREGDSADVPPRKRSLQMCRYCNKSFPDDIIDHHINLHLRQSFFTCIDCNKNFRSEEAMSRHRCGAVQEPINLDPD